MRNISVKLLFRRRWLKNISYLQLWWPIPWEEGNHCSILVKSISVKLLFSSRGCLKIFLI